MALPMLLYLLYVRAYGVNLIYWDEWTRVPLIDRMYRGDLSVANLWAFFGPQRMLVPNLWYLALARVAHFDTRDGMYASALLLIAAYAILCALHRAGGDARLWPLVPAAFLIFSLAPYENALWGFQIAWYIVLVGFVAALFALERLRSAGPAAASPALIAALGAATAASCSSVQGLLVWPCGLLYVIGRGGIRRSALVLWCLAGALVGGVCLWGLTTDATAGHSFVEFLRDPASSAEYFLVVLGAFVPLASLISMTPLQLVYALFQVGVVGMMMLTLYGAVATIWIRRPDMRASLALPVALIAFGVLFDACLVVGRAYLGTWEASSSRYALYSLLPVVGSYLGVVALARGAGGARYLPLVAGLSALVLFQVATAYRAGLSAGEAIRANRTLGADVLVNYRTASDELIHRTLLSDAPFLRQQAAVAEAHGLSVFSDPVAKTYRDVGIVPDGVPGRVLPVPPALQGIMSQDPRARRAWVVLSTVYDRRADLRQYAGAAMASRSSRTPAAPGDLAAVLLEWALDPAGLAVDDREAFLLPYARETQAMYGLLAASEATVGRAYSLTLRPRGGTPPYRWTLLSGALPSGLSLDASTGTISGTPTGPAGQFEFWVQITDGTGATARQPLSIHVR